MTASFVTASHQQAVQRAIGAMHAHLGEHLSNADLARSAAYSRWHFLRLFRKTTGITPGRYLRRQRMAEGQRLLATTDLHVIEVGQRVGYTSAGAFGNAFKSTVGVSPSAYREQQGRVT